MHHPTAATRRASYGLVTQATGSIRQIILIGVFGALAGGVVSFFVQPKWVARMTIQVGQVSLPQGNSSGQGGVKSRSIENQLTAVDRYNLPAMHLRVLNELGLPEPDSGSRDAKVVFDTLTAMPARNPDLIMVQVSAYSRDAATEALAASFKLFAAPNQAIFDPVVNDLKSQLASTSAKLAQAEQDYARISATLQSSTAQRNANTSDPRNVLVTNAATLINQQILGLREQAIELQQATSPLLTYPTRVVEAPYTPSRSNTPGAALLVAIGGALGLLIGVALAMRETVMRRVAATQQKHSS
ncbi:hypothetical protein [Paraburkholderia bryophila]|uniref:Uncharacterized protein involved in exopolysaccharide biosynthesis n=1 Tax=Paraburkholderia bryophila TaxID=420952 RepID=A0A7Y9WD37_9BURK|nr:hypothetical protein [Paraburkholderia bryophila]NYH18482.1 uncharacterized protein involved in exopolysaccharide biosynthesis [Paraburkholderia bryophila]